MFDLFNKLNPYLFLATFAIALFYFYTTNKKTKIIIKEPSPNDETIYNDELNNRFTFITKEIVCPH